VFQRLVELEATYSIPARPNIRMVDNFGKGRVFIAGGKLFLKLHKARVLMSPDAAHVHSPTGGQGMNSGVQDSVSVCS